MMGEGKTLDGIQRERKASIRCNEGRVAILPCGHLIVGFAIKGTACLRFLPSAPLFEEERDVILRALVLDRSDPFLFHRSRTGSTLAADDDPIYLCKVNRAQVFEQRFD